MGYLGRGLTSLLRSDLLQRRLSRLKGLLLRKLVLRRLLVLLKVSSELWLLLRSLEALLLSRTRIACILRLELTCTKPSGLGRIVTNLVSAIRLLLALLGVSLSILRRAWTGGVGPSQV